MTVWTNILGEANKTDMLKAKSPEITMKMAAFIASRY